MLRKIYRIKYRKTKRVCKVLNAGAHKMRHLRPQAPALLGPKDPVVKASSRHFGNPSLRFPSVAMTAVLTALYHAGRAEARPSVGRRARRDALRASSLKVHAKTR